MSPPISLYSCVSILRDPFCRHLARPQYFSQNSLYQIRTHSYGLCYLLNCKISVIQKLFIIGWGFRTTSVRVIFGALLALLEFRSPFPYCYTVSGGGVPQKVSVSYPHRLPYVLYFFFFLQILYDFCFDHDYICLTSRNFVWDSLAQKPRQKTK